MSDIELIKKILLRLYNIVDDRVAYNSLYVLDDELKELLKELKGK